MLPGFVSVLSCSGGGEGGGGKSASVSSFPPRVDVSSSSAVAPSDVEVMLVGTVLFADGGAVSGAEEGTGGSRQVRCPVG